MTRHRKLSPPVLALALLAAVSGCGEGDGDGDGSGDAAISADAVTVADAAPGPALGRACRGDGQGDCPAGFECIAFGPHR